MSDRPIAEQVAELSADERRLVEATALAEQPVPLTVAVQLGAWDESQLLDVGDRLSTLGLIGQTAEGFTATADAAEVLEGMGEMRRSATAGALADAFQATGGGAAAVGPLLAAAARWGEALAPLAEAGIDAVNHGRMGDAVPLLEQAIHAADETGSEDANLRARVHLARAQAYRLMGRSDEAVADAAAASRHADGEILTEAFEWQARLADDQQHSQDADGYLAAAQLTAVEDPARLGTLHSLRARTLGRIGYPNEAEASHDKARALLEVHGSDADRAQATYDEAWVAFDQGRAQDAADKFSTLAARLTDQQAAELADREVWLARSLFAAGKPAEAEEIRQRAMARAEEIGAFGPVFLGHMALAEGAGMYGAWEESLRGADDMLGVVLSTLPAWENAARYLRARALNGLGRHDEAKEEITAALAATPKGINGWRWRNRCRALQWRIDVAAGGKWDDLAPADLTEELLAARFYSQAVELLGDRVKHEKDPELGRSAAALALRVGQPAEAARALATTKFWSEPEGVATAHAIRNITVPDEWAEAWAAAPGVATALAAPEVADATDAVHAMQADLDAVFAEAGLDVEDRRLSPAQRRAAGLRIKQPRQPRRRRRLATFASAAALVVVAGTAGALVALFVTPDFELPPTVETRPPAVGEPEPTTPEETQLVWPDIAGFGASQWAFHGELDNRGFNGDRDGISTRAGSPNLDGYYWKFPTNARIDGSPSVRGETVYIGSANETFYTIDMKTGGAEWTADAGGAIASSPSFAFAPLGESVEEGGGGNENVLFFASEDGTVYGYRTRTGAKLWENQAGGSVTAPLLSIDSRVFVPSEDGRLYAYEQIPPGNLSWVYPPLEEDPLGPLTAAPLYVDGTVIIVSEDGTYAGINGATGEQVCRNTINVFIGAAPAIVGDVAYLAASGSFYEFRPTTCQLLNSQLYGEFPVYASPVVIDNIAYITDGPSMLAFNIDTALFDKPRFRTGATIRSSPVVAGDVMYFGSDDNFVYALDLETFEARWTFQTGGEVRSSPAVGDGVVYFGSRDGFLYAVGGAGDGS